MELPASFGGVQVVVIDSRKWRALEDGQRQVVKAGWSGSPSRWPATGITRLATSLPLLLPNGIHALEAWNEAVCGGAWGNRLARAGE